MRKILIGFISLGVVLGVYLLYTRASKTPRTDKDRIAEIIKSVTDGNTPDLDSQMGKIGDVGIGPAEKAYYFTTNPETQEIEREFGFEKLLHADRGVWDIEKPYMNVYRRNFTCYLTADKGQVLFDGRLSCVSNPREILNCISASGYEECVRCMA